MRSVALGILFTSLPLLAQTATYAVFTNLTPAVAPPDREAALMAHDPVRGRTLLGGGTYSGTRQDTWEWNGATWQQMTPATQLDFNRRIRFVWAPQRSQILAVHGEDVYGGSTMKIHGWTGTNWVLVADNGPVSRSNAFEVAWDSTRGVLVMFGHPFGAETWEWNGSAWALRGTGGPVPRTDHRMVYDPTRQVTVLYGGISLTNQRLTDTWEWNGVYWLERFGIAAPNVYAAGTMAFDPARQRVVLHGGYALTGPNSGAVWEFDGIGWQQRIAQSGPAEMVNHAMAFDAANQRFVLFGGSNWARTRTLRFVSGIVASTAAHGAGCAGPAGVPSLLPVSGGRPVLGTTFQVRFANLPNTPLAPVFGTIGYQDQTWNGQSLPFDLTGIGLPGCFLRIDATATVVLGNTGGVADWSIALPPAPGLDGQQFFLQGAVLVPGFNAAGAVVSDSRSGVAGVL